jgi:hypothetical protein
LKSPRVGDEPPAGDLDLPLRGSWRLSIALVMAGGLAAAGACGLELSGVVARDALLRGAADSERWLGLAVGLLMQPFGWSALRHARLRIDRESLQWPRFAWLCRLRRLRFRDVRRWGTAVATNRGRRERRLLFELHDGAQIEIKLAMYSRPDAALAALQAGIGHPVGVTASLTGLHFDDPR